MVFTVYEVKNLRTGKIYVGVHSTENPNDSYLGSGSAIRNSVKKHGKEAFVKRILFVFESESEALEKEREIVDEAFLKRPDVYNVSLGGGVPDLNCRVSGGKAMAEKVKELGFSPGTEAHRVRGTGFFDSDFQKHCQSLVVVTEEARERQANSVKKTYTENPERNFMFGKTWATNGEEEKLLSGGEPFPEGWRPGRKASLPKPPKISGWCYVHKPFERPVKVKLSDVFEYENKGWVKGRGPKEFW